jgi:hypothetical protein
MKEILTNVANMQCNKAGNYESENEQIKPTFPKGNEHWDNSTQKCDRVNAHGSCFHIAICNATRSTRSSSPEFNKDLDGCRLNFKIYVGL